jgi:hypothetical protein
MSFPYPAARGDVSSVTLTATVPSLLANRFKILNYRIGHTGKIPTAKVAA